MQAPITMNVLTVFQCTAIIAAYFIVMVALPAWALRKRLDGFRLCERFLVYLIFGNFSVINIVLALEIVHLSYPATLAAAYLALLLWLRWHFYGTSLVKLGRDLLTCAEKLAHRTLTWRQVWSLRRIHPLLWLRTQLTCMLKELPSVILLVLLMANVVRVFGTYTVTHYGYVASDLPVHNYWINGLIGNRPFIGGVYPLGYHCVVYFLHAMTQIPVFDFLRVMGLVQTFYFMLTLVAFLRAVCKTRFAPFLALLPFLVATGVSSSNEYPYWRWIAGVPQEHGMLFILPTVWCAFKLFESLEAERKDEKEGSAPKLPFRELKSSRWLIGFALAESLTISVHFYDFFALGAFLVSGALCYALRIIRPRCLWRLLAGGIAGVLLAALPMAIAFALGTPLQGSLNWGMSVINAASAEQTQQAKEETTGPTGGTSESAQTATTADAVQNPATSGQASGTSPATEPATAQTQQATGEPAPSKPSLIERLRSLWDKTIEAIRWNVGMVYEHPEKWFGDLYLWCIVVMLGLAALLWAFRQQDYAAQVATMACALFVLAVMLMAYALPVPRLMDLTRVRDFMAYLVPACVTLGVDAAITLITLALPATWPRDILSLALAIAIGYQGVATLGLQEPAHSERFEPDGNILCLERILREFPDFSWTIVSANEELRMGELYGFHTEINEMLNGMEQRFVWSGTNKDFTYEILPAEGNVIIPTENVFFFIEKVPGLYNIMGAVPDGEPISREWANKILPGLPTIFSYRGANRYIEMSRMYYWAQEFHKRFPNDMRVFYEDDEMICWYLHQPEADYTDLCIDYGYNDCTPRLMLKELSGKDPGKMVLGPDGEYHTQAFVNATNAGLAERSEGQAGSGSAQGRQDGSLQSGSVAQGGGAAR